MASPCLDTPIRLRLLMFFKFSGSGVAGIVLPKKVEKVLLIKKGDAIALISSQPGTRIVKLSPDVKFPEPNQEHYKGMALNCEEAPLKVDIKGSGKVVILNMKNLSWFL